jgi:hypothetical protein
VCVCVFVRVYAGHGVAFCGSGGRGTLRLPQKKGHRRPERGFPFVSFPDRHVSGVSDVALICKI